jgi:hypothetical protein
MQLVNKTIKFTSAQCWCQFLVLKDLLSFEKKNQSQEGTDSYNQFPVLSFLDKVFTLLQFRQKFSFCILSSIAVGYCILF